MSTERDEAIRLIAGHERCAAKYTGALRAQHLESARYLRELHGIDPPKHHPPYLEIVETLTKLGMANALAMFWDAHGHQAEGEAGRQLYWRAYHNMRKLAVAALVGHKRSSIWIPTPVGFSAPMEFVAVTHPGPKGTRDFFSTVRYSK